MHCIEFSTSSDSLPIFVDRHATSLALESISALCLSSRYFVGMQAGYPMRLVVTFIVAFMMAFTGRGLSQNYVEGEMLVADRGNSNNGSDGEVRRYDRTGGFISTLPASGSGQVRALDADLLGNIYVARGNAVLRYTGFPPVADPANFASGSKAQDIAVNPITQEVWVSFGVDASSAQIIQMSAAGVAINTFTDPLVAHPRSMAFDPTGQFLYIANSAAGNVIVFDVLAGTFQVYLDFSILPGGFTAIGLHCDQWGSVYVTGSYGTLEHIYRITGAVGAAVQTLVFDYSTLPGLNAPAGLFGDNHGNLYLANRNKNGATPGIFIIDVKTSIPLLPPSVGAEHKSPIDVAFLPAALDLTVQSPDGVDGNGRPIIDVSAPAVRTVNIDIDAPDHAGATYGMVMSMLDASLALNGTLAEPHPFATGFAAGEHRRLPLNDDLFLSQSLVAVGAGGTGSILLIDLSGPLCPGSAPGTVSSFVGGLNATGQATATFTLPTHPCVPPGLNISYYFGFAVGIMDGGLTAPLGVALLSDRAAILRVNIP